LIEKYGVIKMDEQLKINDIEAGVLVLEKLYADTKKKADKSVGELGKIATREKLKIDVSQYKTCLEHLYSAMDKVFDE
jgi:hypothetical protein